MTGCGRRACSIVRSARGRASLVVGSLAAMAALPVAAVGFRTAHSIPPPSNLARSAEPGFLLEVKPDPVSLGVLEPGRLTDATIRLCSRSGRSVVVERIETTCSCLTADPPPFEVKPGGTVLWSIKFDLSDDPDFLGSLAVGIVGFDATGAVAFKTQVTAAVGAGGPGPPTPGEVAEAGFGSEGRRVPQLGLRH
jgi:hypothetical protein